MRYVSRKKRTKTCKLRSSFEDKGKAFLEKNKISFGYEDTKLPYELSYVVDFSFLSKKTKKPVYIEFKGYFSPEDRRKMKAVRERNPELDIRFVFMRDNLLTKRGKMRYSDWCKKHGYPLVYVVGNSEKIIPQEWLNEMKRK